MCKQYVVKCFINYNIFFNYIVIERVSNKYYNQSFLKQIETTLRNSLTGGRYWDNRRTISKQKFISAGHRSA